MTPEDVSKLPRHRTYLGDDGQRHAYPFGGVDESPTTGDASDYPDPGGANTYEGDGGPLAVPPPGQRHAAGYMEPGESRDYLELMKCRQAQGLPPDPRDGGALEDEGEAQPRRPWSAPSVRGRGLSSWGK